MFCCRGEVVFIKVGDGIVSIPGAAPCQGMSLLMWKDLLPLNMWSGMATL